MQMTKNDLMQSAIHLVVIAFLIFQIGCKSIDKDLPTKQEWPAHVPNSHPGIEAHELDIREEAVRHNSSRFPKHEPVFLAFEFNRPPTGFLERFKDLNLDIRSIESAKFPLGNGVIHNVAINKWLNDSAVLVYYDMNPRGVRMGPGSTILEYELYVFDKPKQQWVFSQTIETEMDFEPNVESE